jgi:hypothetical protein
MKAALEQAFSMTPPLHCAVLHFIPHHRVCRPAGF